MKLQATKEEIITESGSYLSQVFKVTDENLEGLNLFFVISAAEDEPTPLVLKDQDDMTISGEQATIPITTSDNDWAGERWYEFWVEWETGQWAKEFKGKFILTESSNYNQP